MFNGIRNFIRKAVNRLFGKQTIEEALNIQIPISNTMYDKIRLWAQMYENAAPWLEDCNTVSLNLPATIAAEIARGVTIEMESECRGSPRADFLNEYYQKVVDDSRKYVEYGVAVGDVIIRPYVKDGEIGFDYVRAGNHWPVAFDNKGYSTAEVFVDREKIEQKHYTLLSYQRLEDRAFLISNRAYVSDNEGDLGKPTSLASVPRWADLQPEAQINNVDRPLWGHFKTPFANQIEPGSPFSVSGFSRAVDIIEQADKQFSRMLWEYESGERAVFADPTAFQKDKRDRFILPKGKERLFMTLDIPQDDSGGGLLHEYSPEFRDQAIINGLNETLAKVEDLCGLARGTLSDRTEGEAKTATELRILRQRTYATYVDTQQALEYALEQLVYAMDVWASVAYLAPQGRYELTFYWDDSVITDKDADKQRFLSMVMAHLFPFWKYLVEYEGYSEEEAKKLDLEYGAGPPDPSLDEE